MTDELKLSGGLAFEDLYSRAGIVRIDAMFLQHLADQDGALHLRLLAARDGAELAPKERSELMLDLAPQLDDFVGELFGVTPVLRRLAEKHDALAPLYSVKRLFVQRQAAKKVKPEEAERLDGPALEADLAARFGEPVTELSFARHIAAWEEARDDNTEGLEAALNYAAWATFSVAGRTRWQDAVLFRVPHKVDPLTLILVVPDARGAWTLPERRLRRRDGFGLTDAGMDLHQALDQANYCIWCHNQGKDSCAKGLRDRKTGALQENGFGVTLPWRSFARSRFPCCRRQ